ncbi:MAG: glycine--tRNA ligase subunit beta [Desulfovibrio sp.]|jgi:glycyl-tRNA synthetase beta chain|nr:glycine--tRNA ligase subunit beta [Desulfovibrio sp.]
MPAFVLEIGTEELPSRFLLSAEKELSVRFPAALEEAGLAFADCTFCSTPRRLALHISRLAESAAIREDMIIGPSLKAAYDMGGRPTRAAEGFARAQNVTLAEAFTIETEKGEYVAVRKSAGGEKALDILASLCPAVISDLAFPKRMRWGSGNFSFARPMRWILALLGNRLVPFVVGRLSSGVFTYGHRVHGSGPFPVNDAAEYFAVMEQQCGVVAQRADRYRIIKEQGNILAEAKQGVVLWKESLLDEVQGLCEHPVPILGSFDSVYLNVPREVLLTSMESHQKSFGMESENGRLLPYFLTVLNITPQDIGIVKKGWERVLRARLEDARFFWETDLAAGFPSWLNALDSVIFLAPLGSMGDKTRRIESLCSWLADSIQCADSEKEVLREDAMRAGRLSKADLASAMVKEFDTLQGVMGGIYAAHFAESAGVVQAISEQYLPSGPDSPVPASLCGALVSIADKADTLVGCFGLGMIPTGTADPYGLRRASLGIARIALEKGLRFNFSALFSKAMQEYGQREWKILPEQALPRLEEFFALRLKNHFIAVGADALLVEAVLQAGFHDIWAVSARLAALTDFTKRVDYAQSVLTFKRAANVIRKQNQEEGQGLTGCYLSELLVEDAEKALAAELERSEVIFETLWQEDRFSELFSLLGALHPFIDGFFKQVMVMCDDDALRLNRLNLLYSFQERFGRLADFLALQI